VIRRVWWLGPANTLVLLWMECGENPAFFCYLITRSAALWVRGQQS
jgi:hypothetical protein